MDKELSRDELIAIYASWQAVAYCNRDRTINADLKHLKLPARVENVIRKEYYNYQSFGPDSLPKDYSIKLF